MDDLEKAILISFDESGAVDSALKAQAVGYCQQIKETPSICSICIERLCSLNWFKFSSGAYNVCTRFFGFGFHQWVQKRNPLSGNLCFHWLVMRALMIRIW